MQRFPCKNINLCAYLDAELSADLAAAVEEHLKACASCKESLLALRQAKTALDILAKRPDISEPPAGILEAVNERLPKYDWGVFADPVARNLAIGVACLIIVFSLWFKSSQPPFYPQASLFATSQGSVQRYIGKDWQDLDTYSVINPGDSLRAAKNSSLKISFTDEKSWLVLKGGSLLRVEDLRGRFAFSLKKGMVFVRAATPMVAKKLLITTPQARIRVSGTLFSVLADEDKTEVAVLEGSVKLSLLSREEGFMIKPQEKAEAYKDEVQLKALLSQEEKALREEFLYKEKKAGARKLGIISWEEVK